ncbi:sigma-70 family RNA polymerase sigma factor [Microlunatus sp. Gsoil 973]|jgi:RNA polymerase primary sigma factor/RNA polymerase nonessential primary-like sigma factor|uniref:sigma-70 family RNA polymerase sigma factor n=1 Tax=Microlunatus sp. Gsoil 973 TaxID=2672569 RepID=UPI0012B4D91B|nr:sigma-70 family RNA polymerase sigma factor [Microlunatus sp. Gsoil 973]QGN31817.1 sigma-70 family RNA polymerase sigma factor [Microlunatus sp. Gsoil 973]
MALVISPSATEKIGFRLPPAGLSADDEATLATAIEAGVLAAEARRTAHAFGAGEAELIMLEQIGRNAAQLFVESNLRLVAMVVRKEAARSRMSQRELFQEGCLGLIEAVRRFDHRRGPRFATYALHWIRAYVGAISANRAGELNLPASRAGRLREVWGVRARLAQQLGRDATTEELAVEIGKEADWVARLLASGPTQLMDTDQLLGLGLADETSAEQFELIFREAIPGRELLNGLGGLHRRVIELRYGFADGREHSLREIAEELGLPLSTIRRAELRALDELRAVCPQQARVHL